MGAQILTDFWYRSENVISGVFCNFAIFSVPPTPPYLPLARKFPIKTQNFLKLTTKINEMCMKSISFCVGNVAETSRNKINCHSASFSRLKINQLWYFQLDYCVQISFLQKVTWANELDLFKTTYDGKKSKFHEQANRVRRPPKVGRSL